MGKMLYLAGRLLKAKLFGWKKPLQSVIFITDNYDLPCKYCTLPPNLHSHTKTYRQIREELKYCHTLGARFVHLDGGNPITWKDGEENINDLCLLARRTGFYSVSITTNAQASFTDCAADMIWVSIDGTKEFHNKIRGKGSFERLEENIAKSGHDRLFAEMTVSKLNYNDVHDTLLYVRESPYFHSISINFQISSKNTSNLALEQAERNKVIDLILQMKKEGYPVCNSNSELRRMKKQNFTSRCQTTDYVTADGTWYPSYVGHPQEACEKWNICLSAQLHLLLNRRIDYILSFLTFKF